MDESRKMDEQYNEGANKGALFLAQIPSKVYALSFAIGYIIAFVKQGLLFYTRMKTFGKTYSIILDALYRLLCVVLQGGLLSIIIVVVFGMIIRVIENRQKK